MKLHCGPSWQVRYEQQQQWHRWFAWRPVRVAEGDCRWLEFVERKGKPWDCWGHGGWDWQYRARTAA